jgi:hypothetical protein
MTATDLAGRWLASREDYRIADGWYIDVKADPVLAERLQEECELLWSLLVAACDGVESNAHAVVNRLLLG